MYNHREGFKLFGDLNVQYKDSNHRGDSRKWARFKVYDLVEGVETTERTVRYDENGVGSFDLRFRGERFNFQSAPGANTAADDWPIVYVCGNGMECREGICGGPVEEPEVEMCPTAANVQLNRGQSLRGAQGMLTKDDLPNLLGDETFTNSKGESTAVQRLYFKADDTAFMDFMESDDDVEADFLLFRDNKELANYTVEFEGGIRSDIEDENGRADPNGLYLDDFKGRTLTLLGKDYKVFSARRYQAGDRLTANVRLKFVADESSENILEGESKDIEYGGNTYTVTVTFMDENRSRISVNGEMTDMLMEGETYTLAADGKTLVLADHLYQSYAGGVHSVTVYIADDVFEIKDTMGRRIRNEELKVSDETIDGALVKITGYEDDGDVIIQKISIAMTTQDDYYVPVGGKLSENQDLDERQLLFTNNWDIKLAAVRGDVAHLQIGEVCGNEQPLIQGAIANE